MAENSVAPVARGKTFFDGGTVDTSGGKHLEGTVHVFPTTDPDDTTNRRDGGNVTCILVRNSHSAALLPGIVVKWKTDATSGSELVEGREVVGGDIGLKARAAGVVDDHLPAAGVPVGDLFWLVVKGQCKCTVDGAVAAGAIVLSAAADGHVKSQTSLSNLEQLYAIGINGGHSTISDNGTGVINVNILTNGV